MGLLYPLAVQDAVSLIASFFDSQVLLLREGLLLPWEESDGAAIL